MALVDEVKIHIRAGRGGSGVVRWLHEKNKEYSGPSGGNGGAGGDVYAEAVLDLSALVNYKNIKLLEAGDGNDGAKKSRQGGEGKDLIVKVPVGSILTNEATRERFELNKEGERVLI